MTISNDSLLDMVNKLLDYAHLESGKTPLNLSKNSLSEIIDHAIQQVEPLIQTAKSKIQILIPDKFPEIIVDKNLLERLLINLLSNSLHHISIDGTGTITLTARQKHHYWQLTVQDNGPGIPEAVLPTLFEPYRQGLTRKIGSGLGLSICKMIMERHGGKIEVSSTPNNGAYFVLTFPLHDDHSR